MASALASLVRKYLDRVASRGPAAEFEAFVAPDVTVQEFPSRRQARTPLYRGQRTVKQGNEVAVEPEWERSAGNAGNEFSGGHRNRGVRRSVSYLSRWKNRFATKLRLLPGA